MGRSGFNKFDSRLFSQPPAQRDIKFMKSKRRPTLELVFPLFHNKVPEEKRLRRTLSQLPLAAKRSVGWAFLFIFYSGSDEYQPNNEWEREVLLNKGTFRQSEEIKLEPLRLRIGRFQVFSYVEVVQFHTTRLSFSHLFLMKQ